jgi:HSP20 family protein
MARQSGFPSRRNAFQRELEHFLRDFPLDRRSSLTRQRQRNSGTFPAVNIYDNGESFLLRAELPGIDDDHIDIHASADEISIRGERHIDTPSDDANFHRRERQGGSFRRSVTLPARIEVEQVTAELENGVLEIRAPRSADEQPKQIDIQG